MERNTDFFENKLFPFKAEEKKVVWAKHFLVFWLFVTGCLEKYLLIERTHYKALSCTGDGTCCTKAGYAEQTIRVERRGSEIFPYTF